MARAPVPAEELALTVGRAVTLGCLHLPFGLCHGAQVSQPRVDPKPNRRLSAYTPPEGMNVQEYFGQALAAHRRSPSRGHPKDRSDALERD